MIKSWIKGKVTSCEKVEFSTKLMPKEVHRTMIKLTHNGFYELPEDVNSSMALDLPTEVPVGASIEFIYEIGEAE
jgi:hypothetical protein